MCLCFSEFENSLFLKLFSSNTFPLRSSVMHGPLLAPRTEKGRDAMLQNGSAFPLHVQNLLQELRQVQNIIMQKSDHFGTATGLSWQR